MKRQISRISVLAGLTILSTGAVLAQKTTTTDQVPGFYNPKTHTFQMKVQPEVDPDVAAPKIYSGTLKYEITVKLVTPVASGQELACSGTALIEDVGGATYYEESVSGIAKVSGSSATCTLSLPYSWSLSAATSDTISLGYDLEIVATTTNAALEFTGRTHTSGLAPLKVPAVGATTAIPISATI